MTVRSTSRDRSRPDDPLHGGAISRLLFAGDPCGLPPVEHFLLSQDSLRLATVHLFLLSQDALGSGLVRGGLLTQYALRGGPVERLLLFANERGGPRIRIGLHPRYALLFSVSRGNDGDGPAGLEIGGSARTGVARGT